MSSFWKIFMISVSLASIWFDRCDCASYNYFGVRDVTDSDVGRALSESNSRKTIVRQVSETKPPVNKSTRGLYYPDDMFFTNWVPYEPTADNCSRKQSPVTKPSCSTSKSTLQKKNNEISTKYQTTVGQQKSSFAVKSSTSSPQISTLAGQKTSKDLRNSKINLSSSSSHQQKSTFDVKSSTIRQRISTLTGQRSSKGRRNSKLALPSSSNGQQKSTSDLKRSTTDKQNPSSSQLPMSTSILTKTNLRIQEQKSTVIMLCSPSGQRKSSVQSSSPRDQRRITVDVETATSGPKSYRLSTKRFPSAQRMSTDQSASSHQRKLKTTTKDTTLDLEYFTYDEDMR
ncbi:cell wall protein RBR3-like [Myzus persicae]|uniref:cell wall protein RBR3-like n=1 Tax=Myzus persicae TaxID=13164 RepID=UPI000B9323E4|nr:cell wall protein RBR3-like [Myzus persicae]